MDLNEILMVAQNAAVIAGSKIRSVSLDSSSSSQLTMKSSSTDLVTETDKQCEELVMAHIRHHFPTHKIIGEEDSGSERYELTDDETWTVDPIDGTTNFCHRLKLSCVIISFLKKKEVLVGVIYDPYADELFYAVKGSGAFMTKKGMSNSGNDDKDIIPIHVSQTKTITNAVISLDPGYGRDSVAVERFTAVQKAILSRSVRHVRVIGSTGLNMAWVACGRYDCAFEEGSWEGNRGPKIWDFAAGSLLVKEAGGITRDLECQLTDDKPLDLLGRSFFCASNEVLANEILDAIAEGRAECK